MKSPFRQEPPLGRFEVPVRHKPSVGQHFWQAATLNTSKLTERKHPSSLASEPSTAPQWPKDEVSVFLFFSIFIKPLKHACHCGLKESFFRAWRSHFPTLSPRFPRGVFLQVKLGWSLFLNISSQTPLPSLKFHLPFRLGWNFKKSNPLRWVQHLIWMLKLLTAIY